MFEKILIANRGVIACRIIRTLRRMGIASVAVFSDADEGGRHVEQADEAVRVGPAAAAESYLNAAAIIEAARRSGAQAVHPGYGFLSESPTFAARCEDAGLAFIGPTPQQIQAFGLKHAARALARQTKVPLIEGTEVLADVEAALEQASRVGYPVMLKATAGGGGIGMRVCDDAQALRDQFQAVTRLASSHFGDGGLFLERYVRHARHIEVQIFGDGHGRIAALGERDCSLQRRNQKVIEETPAPGLDDAARERLRDDAVRLMKAVSYRSAGTVEFLYDSERRESYFLEVNTRLQVEHGVTEQVSGIDLVEWMIRCANGERAFLEPWLESSAWASRARGVSIQARLYAEDPARDYRPSAGTLSKVEFPAGIRVESAVTDGSSITSHYDPLLAKIIVTAPTRAAAVQQLQQALDQTKLSGIETNVEWLRAVARSESVLRGELSTRVLQTVRHEPRTIRVVSGGLCTTVQDYPGRLGYWSVGVPPSGPMDDLAFRLGNRLLGNPSSAAGLEWTATGPTLEFDCAVTLCLTGADSAASLDGQPLDRYRPIEVAPGQQLKLGRLRGPGMRGYVLVHGGIETAEYLGSRSTFTLGGFGGHAGRALAAGDVLHLGPHPGFVPEATLPAALIPQLSREWRVRVLYGPHGAPDYFTDEDIHCILNAAWRVHYNSSRTGIRLLGPRPTWARRDGGEAGLHPSNIHDNPYAIGAIDFTGDMPIILGPDGPSLGGFVCPFVTVRADLWKLGQLAPGDIVRFESIDEPAAATAARKREKMLTTLRPVRPPAHATRAPRTAVLAELAASPTRPRALYRRQGDSHVLIEYGAPVLDLTLRIRVHALMLEFERQRLPGVIDVTPGIRSLQIHYDSSRLSRARLLDCLMRTEERLGSLDAFETPSRVVHLPLSFRDPAVEETVSRYMNSVRADAPWCPDNIEFIRRVNGLGSPEDVRRIVFDASYLVVGLGDVYLGAPVAVPLDPRHRLVTTKYNPARTWTPPNVVGIGGAYLCIYGLEGPGGYQLFGRTIQVWNSYPRAGVFGDEPWLLRFFDQIRFFPVTPEELRAWRAEFPLGRRTLRIEPETFRLADYRRFLAENRADIDAFQSRRQHAFDAERDAWQRDAASAPTQCDSTDLVQQPINVPPGVELVEAPLGGSICRVLVESGDRIERGMPIALIEAMKSECSVPSPISGHVRAVYVRLNQPITPGAPLVAIEPVANVSPTGD